MGDTSWPIKRAFTSYDGGYVTTDAVRAQVVAMSPKYIDGPRVDDAIYYYDNLPGTYLTPYNSLTDDYIPGGEYSWLMANAASYGVTDPEDVYLHFWNDTVVNLQGQNILVRGYGGPTGTATTKAESRVPTYYANLTRFMCNFSTSAIRTARRMYDVVNTLQVPFAAGRYWSGIWYDNASSRNFNVSIVSGGAVREDPAHSVFGSRAFQDWYWFQGQGLYLLEFRNWVATNPAELGGRPCKIIANIAYVPTLGSSDWSNDYITFNGAGTPPADCLFMEFVFNPVRNDGRGMPATMYAKFAEAAAAGVDIWETGYSYSVPYSNASATMPNASGDQFTDTQIHMGICALHWVARSDTSYLTGYANSWVPAPSSWQPAPYGDGTCAGLGRCYGAWQHNTWPIWNIDLGQPLGAPSIIQTGTDGRGYGYDVYGREFELGYAIIRQRGDWNQRLDALTSVNVTLPAGTWLPVTSLAGDVGTAVATYPLRNGEGAIFKRSGAAADTTPPAAVADLACSASTQSTVTLGWSAPADDDGSIVSSYEIRYSTSAITSGNFASATLWPSPPSPNAPGDPHLLVVTGLTPSTTYHFALKSRDSNGNTSAISNVPSRATTAAADVTAPSAISTLAAVAASPGPDVLLSWTSTGDDAGTGTATSYDIRWSTSTINAGNFAAATALTESVSPAVAGTPQSILAHGTSLAFPGRWFGAQVVYFAMKVTDEAGNTSAISNVVSVTTNEYPDTLAPNHVTDLAVVARSESTVTVSWTAPGDDEDSGTASYYEIRYSTSAITEGSWPSATVSQNPPTPAIPYTVQSHVITGLAPGTVYYIAMKTFDDQNNASQLSTVESTLVTSTLSSPTAPTQTIRVNAKTMPPRRVAGAPALFETFPRYANLYWSDKWGAANETTPGRDQILRVLAGHDVVIFNEANTNPLTIESTGKDYGIEDAASRLKVLNNRILVGISVNAWTANNVGGGGSLYYPFQTALYNACEANDWWLRFDNDALVYSDGATAGYRLFDVTNPNFRTWYTENIRRYFMSGLYDHYDFLFFDEMHSTLFVPNQGGKTSANLKLFGGSTTTRTLMADSTVRNAAWAAGNAAIIDMIPDLPCMPNGTVEARGSMIGRMLQGLYPATKPDNELPTINGHFLNTLRNNRLMFVHAEWGSSMPQWLNTVGLTDSQLLDADHIATTGAYLAQGSWETYRAACRNIAIAASIFDAVAQLEITPPGLGNFKHPWQYFGYEPGAFGMPVEYADGTGNEQPRIFTEKINQGNTNSSGIYWRRFTKATIAFNWQWNGGTPTALTWSESGASIPANTGAVIFR